MRFAVVLLACASPALAQHFSAGIKAGVPFTDFVSTVASGNASYFTHTNRYIFGVSGELRLPFGLGIELDALYRRLNFNFAGQFPSVGIGSATATSNAWEFPLMAKYRFPTRIARPYLAMGVAWDTLQGLTETVTKTVNNITSTSSTSNPSELHKNTTMGYVLGIGLDVHALVIHVSPEIRYTRWGAQHFLDPNGLLSSNQNQAEFLVGISF